MVYWASGAVFAAQDKPEDPSYLFTPANVKDGNFIYSSTGRRTRHNSAAVQWNNPENSYKLEPELFELEKEIIDGGGFRFLTERTLFGCTSRGQATRDAKWALYTDNYQTETVSFGVGLAGMELRPGDVIAIMDPLRLGGSLGGRVKSIQGNVVTLDRTVTVPPGVQHNLIVSNEKGIVEEHIVLTSGTSDTLTLKKAIKASENSIWILVSEDAVPELWRVVATVMNGDGDYSVTAISYDPQKFGWVERGIDLLDRRKWLGFSSGDAGDCDDLEPPQGLVLTEGLYKDKEDLKVYVQAQWASSNDSTVGFLPSCRIDEGNWINMSRTDLYTVEIKPVEAPCVLDFSVCGISVGGKISQPATGTIPA
jgi:predicted phage tail protein